MGLQRFIRIEMTPDLDGVREDREVPELEGLHLKYEVGVGGELMFYYEDDQLDRSPYLDQVFAANEWVHFEWDARNAVDFKVVS